MVENLNKVDLLGGVKYYYRLENSREVQIFTNSNVVEERDKESITKLKIGNTTFCIGDKFKHQNKGIPSDYKIAFIVRGKDGDKGYRYNYSLFTHNRNKTTTYLLPCLATKKSEDNSCFHTDSYLINAYLDEDWQESTSLYLKYRFGNGEQYGKLESNLRNHKHYVNTTNDGEGFDIFEFNIPNEHYKDVERFCNGKYSWLSSTLKDKIKYFYKLNDKSRTMQILNKSKELVAEFEKMYNCYISTTIDLENKPKVEEEIL